MSSQRINGHVEKDDGQHDPTNNRSDRRSDPNGVQSDRRAINDRLDALVAKARADGKTKLAERLDR